MLRLATSACIYFVQVVLVLVRMIQGRSYYVASAFFADGSLWLCYCRRKGQFPQAWGRLSELCRQSRAIKQPTILLQAAVKAAFHTTRDDVMCAIMLFGKAKKMSRIQVLVPLPASSRRRVPRCVAVHAKWAYPSSSISLK